jgi:hypothetical protein
MPSSKKSGAFLELSWVVNKACLQSRQLALERGSNRAYPVNVNAIETTGVVDAQRQLRLDEPLPIAGPSRVRVIILVPEAGDLGEHEWTKAVANNPAFDFLKDAGEDIYTRSDGKPFHDQG